MPGRPERHSIGRVEQAVAIWAHEGEVARRLHQPLLQFGTFAAELGKAGGGKPKNIVDWTPTKLSATVFKFETKAPLDAGEYAVTTVPVLNGELWDFGVK